jgi:hypothetical protein
MKIYATSLGPVLLESQPSQRVGAYFPRVLRALLLNAGLENVELKQQDEEHFRFYRDLSDDEFRRVEQILEGFSARTSPTLPRLPAIHRALRDVKLRSLSAA